MQHNEIVLRGEEARKVYSDSKKRLKLVNGWCASESRYVLSMVMSIEHFLLGKSMF